MWVWTRGTESNVVGDLIACRLRTQKHSNSIVISYIHFSPLLHCQDYVTIYDGYTTRDPAILRFCGGGQAVPAAISSGPELLVEFTTSPYGSFTIGSSSLSPLYGFQLEVS